MSNQLPTDYQAFIHKSRYAKYYDGSGRESWGDTVSRFTENIIGNLVGTWAELTELMELANRGLVDLTTKEYALSDANTALRHLHEGKIHGRAVLIP